MTGYQTVFTLSSALVQWIFGPMLKVSLLQLESADSTRERSNLCRYLLALSRQASCCSPAHGWLQPAWKVVCVHHPDQRFCLGWSLPLLVWCHDLLSAININTSVACWTPFLYPGLLQATAGTGRPEFASWCLSRKAACVCMAMGSCIASTFVSAALTIL